jgi:hypothetical protein
METVVVFPAPFGPSSPMVSPARLSFAGIDERPRFTDERLVLWDRL